MPDAGNKPAENDVESLMLFQKAVRPVKLLFCKMQRFSEFKDNRFPITVPDGISQHGSREGAADRQGNGRQDVFAGAEKLEQKHQRFARYGQAGIFQQEAQKNRRASVIPYKCKKDFFDTCRLPFFLFIPFLRRKIICPVSVPPFYTDSFAGNFLFYISKLE